MVSAAPPSAPPARLVSLDAFRGATLLLMASGGFGITAVAEHFPDSAVWRFARYHGDHARWSGCSFWDLIQPAFMFMVGVSLPWSVAGRQARGQTFGCLFGSAVRRAVILVLLAVFLSSAWSRQTEWSFTNVLAQIGLGYPFLFLLAFARPRAAWIAALSLLAAYWAAFALYPLPPADFDWTLAGVPGDWPHLSGFAGHWEKNTNAAAAFDTAFLNLFPRKAPFVFNAGGYQTLNFIPSLATMIFGLIAGRLLRSEIPVREKITRLLLAGVAGIAAGKAIDVVGLCPIVKRIWTPSWALYSAGWVTLIFAGFVALIDWRGCRRWTFPLVVAGLNPITLYCLWQLSGGFIRQQIQTHLGQHIFESFGVICAPLLERAAVLLVLWLVLFWMYRRKLFLRI